MGIRATFQELMNDIMYWRIEGDLEGERVDAILCEGKPYEFFWEDWDFWRRCAVTKPSFHPSHEAVMKAVEEYSLPK